MVMLLFNRQPARHLHPEYTTIRRSVDHATHLVGVAGDRFGKERQERRRYEVERCGVCEEGYQSEI